MDKITNAQIDTLAHSSGLEYATLKAIIEVESGGVGFAPDTGKIIIQFEPVWFRRMEPYTPSGLWSLNKVERQAQEWKAFNSAFAVNPDHAMQSTSIGMMQVMGFHFHILDFDTVGDMWDYAKVSEYNQVDLALRFIKSNRYLYLAFKHRNWALAASYYNGKYYWKHGYHTKLRRAYEDYLPEPTKN
jgi:hypothetical protein